MGNKEKKQEITFEADLVQEAREHIAHAAGILKKLGPAYSTVSWMVEDVLMYVDNVSSDSVSVPFSDFSEENEEEIDPRQVSLKGFRPQ